MKAHIISIVSLVISLFSFTAFIWSSKKNQELVRNQQEWQENVRRNEIFPDIQLTQETGFDQKTFDQVTIVFENIGKGTAQDIFLWIGYSNRIIPMVFHDFTPIGGGPNQNYIKTGEKLKFLFDVENIFGEDYANKSLKDKLDIALPSTWTFYFSYFDIDGNEYLLTTTEHPAGVRGEMLLNVKKGAPIDSLLLSLPRTKKAIYKELKIRNEFRYVKKSLAK